MPKGLLSNLVIEEVAFCARGMNPEADMVIWKSRNPKPTRKKVAKQEDEPSTFGDHFESERAMEIDSALDRRLHALLAATTEIMRADGVDREALVLAAVNDYAATMNRDVPELFAGRLAKWLASWDADGDLPDDDTIRTVVKEELEVVGLIDDITKGENMDWLKSLTKDEREALDLVLAGTDPAEFFKGVDETQGAFVVALVKRAVKATAVEGELAKTVEELTKARTDAGTDEGIDAVIAKIDDPAVRSLVEMQRKKIRKQDDTVALLQKTSRRRELADIAKSLDCLPNENGSLVDALEKADAAGILDTLKTILTAANTQAKVGKQLEELGIDSLPGQGAAGTPAEADEALMAKAIEMKKSFPTLSDEQLYAKACDQNPDLYEATRSPAVTVN